MKRNQRLRKTIDFQTLYHTGYKITLHGLVLYYHPSHTADHRMGIVISRKIGQAVIRNRFKRRMRVLFRLFQTKITTFGDLLWVATRPSIARLSFEALQNRVNDGLNQLSLHLQNTREAQA